MKINKIRPTTKKTKRDAARRLARLSLAGVLSLASATGLLAKNDTPLNGAQPRPFYAFAHNPNSLQDVEAALKKGFNALEPDISEITCGGQEVLIDFDTDLGVPDCGSIRFADWCTGVNKLAQQYPKLAYVVLDIKAWASDPGNDAQVTANMNEIVNDVRTLLNANGVNLNVTYSVANHKHAQILDKIISQIPVNPLLEREGLQIDGEDDAGAVVQYFFDQGFTGNISFGDGTSTVYAPLPRAMDYAAFLRASIGYPKAVSYVYVLTQQASMNSYIYSGVDGVIALDADQDDLLAVIPQHPEIRMAKREDNPFQPANEAYGLEVVTGDNGTDADIEFIITGCRGSASIRIDGGWVMPLILPSDRFEAGQTDWATIPSKDLGELQSITIKNLGGGGTWKPATVAISSARYIGPNGGTANPPRSREYRATFNVDIPSGGESTMTLTPNFTLPAPSIQGPGNIVVPNDPGQCGAVVNFSFQASGLCDDIQVQADHPSGSLFPVGVTTVTATATGSGGTSQYTFSVTVNDTEPPVIHCPAPLVISATGPNGAIASFAPTVSDNCPGATVVSVPASGSLFAIGDTLVTSTATDASKNQAWCSFNVHVKGAAEQAADLLTAVNNLNIKAGNKNSLLVKLTAALAAIQNSNSGLACSHLSAFINEVSAQSGKALTVSDANQLLAAAQQIRKVLGCQ